MGVNSTYRGDELLRLIDHSDCQVVVTSSVYGGLLDDAGFAMDPRRVLRTDTDGYRSLLASVGSEIDSPPPRDDDLFLLIFTSGSTSFPKAVRCTQGRFARTGAHVATVAALGDGDGDAIYSPLPFFHSSSLFTGLAASLASGVPLGTRSKFSASKTMDDIRRTGTTVMTYTGKVLNYLLAVPERSDDSQTTSGLPSAMRPRSMTSAPSLNDSTARSATATAPPKASSSSGVTPPCRRAHSERPTITSSCSTRRRVSNVPRSRRAPDGTILNATEATGEIVNLSPGQGFEGYYRNNEATSERFRQGRYWSGDLAYRDAQGWFYFAGRSNEWLRVDGENFAAGVVESILGRFGAADGGDLRCPGPPVGDRVMTALELDDPGEFRHRGIRAVPPEPARPGAEVGSGICAPEQGVAQAGQPEGGQDSAPTRGVARRSGVLETEPGRSATAAHRNRS